MPQLIVRRGERRARKEREKGTKRNNKKKGTIPLSCCCFL
jgi:hypothetical protein